MAESRLLDDPDGSPLRGPGASAVPLALPPHDLMSDDAQLATDTPTDLAPGTVLSFSKQYQVVGRLGEGGMGKVFKAFDPIMNRYVALKVMKVDVPESERRRFRLEARLCGGFMHPNLVRVLDVGTTREHGLFWFVMEFLEGMDMTAAMASGRPIPMHVLKTILECVLDALHYVHLRKIVHRDVKPANIFVTRDPHDPEHRPVKLLDFGVAKDLSDPNPDKEHHIMGDPRYLPPEQTRANRPVDGRADLYALGMSFFEAVTGHHPFEDMFDQHPRELLQCQRERTPVMPSTFLGPSISRDQAQAIDDFFATACAKDPADRFGNARAMLNAMDAMTG
jgi:serine/threonine-protein kinase